MLKDERKESIGAEPLTPKNSFTGMGSAAAASGASPPEDISKALRGSLNLLSSGFSGSPGPSRREVKERDRFQRTTTPPGKLNKPRLITMIKDQVPRPLPCPLPSKPLVLRLRMCETRR